MSSALRIDVGCWLFNHRHDASHVKFGIQMRLLIVSSSRHLNIAFPSSSLSLSLPSRLSDLFLQSALRHPLLLAQLRERRSLRVTRACGAHAHSRAPVSHVRVEGWIGKEWKREKAAKSTSRGTPKPPAHTADAAAIAAAVDAAAAAATAAAAAATPGAARLWVSD